MTKWSTIPSITQARPIKADTFFYDEYDLTGGKDYDINSEANVSALPSCYFTVTVKDTVSGVSETIKVWLVTSVKSVSLDKTNVSI
ncbi:MAG: hypothetical protein ACLTAN_10885 [Christensenellaceae bacterium]